MLSTLRWKASVYLQQCTTQNLVLSVKADLMNITHLHNLIAYSVPDVLYYNNVTQCVLRRQFFAGAAWQMCHMVVSLCLDA